MPFLVLLKWMVVFNTQHSCEIIKCMECIPFLLAMDLWMNVPCLINAANRDPYSYWNSTDSSLIYCLHPGARLVINPSWKNPSQEWHVGCKLIYELFTDTLISRLKVNFIFSAYTPNFLYWTWYLNKDLPTRTSERKKEEMGRGKPGSNFQCSEAAEWIWKGLGPFWLHLDSPLLPIVYFIVCTAFSLLFAV